MTKEINGQTYYRTSEVCETIGISRSTLFRWLKNGILPKCCHDRRGWRLYTEEDVIMIRAERNKLETEVFVNRE
jgi:excisionase family DNA binding protein